MPDIRQIVATIIQGCRRVSETAAAGRGGRKVRGRRIQEWGFANNPPPGSPIVAVCEFADSAQAFYIVTGNRAGPPLQLAEGETLVYGGDSTILLKASGDIEIHPAGDVKVIGGDVIADGISLKNHTHRQNDGNHFGGGGETDPPQ